MRIGQDKSTNGKDDDGNGFIDDVVGWDFVTNDNKPFDLTLSMFEIILGGGIPVMEPIVQATLERELITAKGLLVSLQM